MVVPSVVPDTVSMAREEHSRTVLLVIGSIVGLLVIVAVVLATRPPAQLDPSTPEGAVQGFYRAIVDGDGERALDHLTPSNRDSCDPSGVRQMPALRATVVVDSVVSDDRDARVDVDITEHFGGGPFDLSSYTFEDRLVLEHDGEEWLLVGVPWPLDRYCRPEVR